MKIVLINTPSLHAYGKIRSGHNCSFPLGLGYIAAFVRNHGHSVMLFDPEAHMIPLETLWKEIKEFSPDIIGITSVTPNFMMARSLAKDAKEKVGCYVIMGGPHASAIPKTCLESSPHIDAVIKGEGEYPMLEIANAFDRKGYIDFAEIPGAVFRGDETINRVKRSNLMEDLDSLPYPARDLVDISKYRLHPQFQRGTSSATILSSRGCPSKCTYCANHTMARRFRPNSPGYFVNELKFLVNEYGIRHFHIVDDCFAADEDRLEQICDMIIRENLGITWFCFGRVDTLQNEKVLRKMRKSGCLYSLLGIESGSQRLLDIMKKGTTLEMAEECCAKLRANNIKYFNSFIIGNEGETEETVMETINFAKKLKSVMVGFNIMIPFPGTYIFNKYFKDYNKPDTNWDSWCSVGDDIPYDPRQTELSKNDLLRLTSLAYKKTYLNPGQLLRMAAFINNPRTVLGYARGGFGLARQVSSWTVKSLLSKTETQKPPVEFDHVE